MANNNFDNIELNQINKPYRNSIISNFNALNNEISKKIRMNSPIRIEDNIEESNFKRLSLNNIKTKFDFRIDNCDKTLTTNLFNIRDIHKVKVN